MSDLEEAHGKKHILFVDDDEFLVELNVRRLTKLEYEVTATTSSLAALRIFEGEPNKFDLILTDDVMPGISGIDLAKKVLDIRPDIPVILSASIDESTAITEAEGINITAVSVKPATSQEIMELIRDVLHGAEQKDTRQHQGVEQQYALLED